MFGIGDPLPNQKYFANGSMQGLFLWNEDGQGQLTMLMARLAYEGAHGAPECTASTPPANPSPAQWCGIKTNYGSPQTFSGAAAGLMGTYAPPRLLTRSAARRKTRSSSRRPWSSRRPTTSSTTSKSPRTAGGSRSQPVASPLIKATVLSLTHLDRAINVLDEDVSYIVFTSARQNQRYC